jgi:hypothetical protein
MGFIPKPFLIQGAFGLFSHPSGMTLKNKHSNCGSEHQERSDANRCQPEP